MDDRVRFALEKLLNVAHEDSGQGRRVATCLLAWWNAEVHGGFDLTDLANVDPHLGEDMATILTFLAREEDVVYPYDYRREIEAIIALAATGGTGMTAPRSREPATPSAIERRAGELDTIAAVLPIDRRDALAELLTDQDVETLRHLVNEGMGDEAISMAASR